MSGLVIPPNQWSFVAVVIEPTTATLYLGTNGVLNAAVDFSLHRNESFGFKGEMGHQPGRAVDNRVFDGSIDDVAVFKRSLNFDEVNALYDAGLGSIHIRPPPAPQQKVFSRFRGISFSSITGRFESEGAAANTDRGASWMTLTRAR